MTTGATDFDDRLPATVSPRRYELHLAPDLSAATYEGSERIEIEVLDTVEAIDLHATELEIRAAALAAGWKSAGGAPGAATPLEWRLEPELERVTFIPPGPLEPGRYTLSIGFAGVLNDKLCGFYRSTYTDEAGETHVIATTQFEETDARRAFPCFDQPDKKAVFSVTLDVPAGLFAVSNGDVVEETELEGGTRRVRFGDTIPMSTYLVAFVVGPLEATEPVLAHGVRLRVVHVPGKAAFTAPALEAAEHALGFYRDYFGIPYPSDKLDLVALPDFAAGAMENLGCVTFREAILLADPNATSRPELQRLAEVVEHEIAHMWFGDLVTMRWWNGIWLNEAFATFMALRCQDDYRPEWKCFVGFSRDKGSALGVDALHSTRPIEVPVRRPEEAAIMFDVLTYEKGASVLWMLERYVGREVFRDGVRRYLAAHRYDNTETTDLWDAIEAEAGEGIREVMDGWIFQGGYPIVSVDAVPNGGLALSPAPFAYLPEPPAGTSAIGAAWRVPVVVRDDGGDETRVLLADDGALVPGNGRLRVVNADGAGFYRVRYAPELVARLADAGDELGPGERYNLVADVWATVLAGLEPLGAYLALLPRLAQERDPDVWSAVIGTLGFLERSATAEDRPRVAAATRTLLRPVLERVGWSAAADEDEGVPLLRAALWSALGTFGDDPLVIARCRELFAADHERHEAIDPNLIGPVLGVVTAHATPAEFAAILARYREPESPMDQIRHLNTLVNLEDEALAAEVREMCRSEVRSQNAPYLLGGLLRGRSVGPGTWAFVTEHFEELTGRFPENSIHRMLDGLSWLIADDDATGDRVLADVRAFCEAHISPTRRRLVDQTLERLEVNLAFARRERAGLGAALEAALRSAG